MINIHDEQKTRTPPSAFQKGEREETPTSKSPAAPGQHWGERLLGVVNRYPVPFGAVTLMLAALVLWLAGRGDFANWMWLSVALLGGIPLLWESLQQVFHREFGVDIIAILAIGGSIFLQEYLVGIPTMTAIDPQFETPANGVGFAIPSNRVRFIAPQLIETGKVTHTGRAALGIQMTSVDPAFAAQNQLAVTAGVLVIKITPNSPAAVAGLKPGDVIVQIGRHTVTNVATFAEALMTMNPGEVVHVQIYRGKEPLTVNVTLGEASAP